DFPSVGATETILMAAVLADGETVIDNAAREPEIIDICSMLLEMGSRIGGVGPSTLVITGVDSLNPVTHATVPDRIVGGTWAVAAAMTGGDITVLGAHAEHLGIALEKLTTAGATVTTLDDGFRVVMQSRPKAVDIVTLPYPGFPTDLQPQFIALNAISQGAALVTENLFEARFRFVQELARLGADVRTDGHHALVRGRPTLSAAPVEATDIRARDRRLATGGEHLAGSSLVAGPHEDPGSFQGRGEVGAHASLLKSSSEDLALDICRG
ncbi:MAG: UDP-N-acetylglucosamine 1-carboxyvinyltransferase, partial [Actinobacteria bacterium]|nr:UDP-N-acetylglucosamine 1-carboxyvinyltransferase [Actinomycetota bacterium]